MVSIVDLVYSYLLIYSGVGKKWVNNCIICFVDQNRNLTRVDWVDHVCHETLPWESIEVVFKHLCHVQILPYTGKTRR